MTRLLRTASRIATNHQRGFATIAKAGLIAIGGGSVALLGMLVTNPVESPRSTAPESREIRAPASNESRNDPDAELRAWLREPDPPTF